MAIQQIQYDDKEAINIDSAVPDKNKCNASDLNEIKEVVNGNSYETPKVSSQVDTDYKVNILSSKNLFDKVIRIDNSYISSTGEIVSNNNCCIYEYISVKPNTTYILTYTSSDYTFMMRLCEYTDNKTFIQRTTTTTGTLVFTTTANTKYVDISGLKSDTNIMLEYGSTASTYEPFIPNTINVNNEKYTDTINVGATINDKNRVNVLYSKNLLPYPYLDTTKTTNGITFTDNGDGTITISGTASANASFKLLGDNANQVEIVANYVSGGISANRRVQVVHYNPGYTVIGNSTGTPKGINKSTYTTGYVEIVIASGEVITTPITIKPMLTMKSDDVYEPYVVPSINIDGEEIYSKPVVLWTNSSPRTQFASQTITLNDNMSNYKYIDFIYYDDVDANNIYTNRIYDYQTKARLTAFIFYSNNLYFRQRVIQKSNDTQIAINDTQQFYINNPTTTTQNNGCIPHQILGYK